jgi:hypothetical protein
VACHVIKAYGANRRTAPSIVNLDIRFGQVMTFKAPKFKKKKKSCHDYDAVQIGTYYQLEERAPSVFWAAQEDKRRQQAHHYRWIESTTNSYFYTKTVINFMFNTQG